MVGLEQAGGEHFSQIDKALMPPTLNIGVPTIASSLGLSVQVRMIPSWNGSNGVRDSNGKSMSSIQPTSSTEFNESASEFRPGEYGGARVAGGSILPVPVAGLYPSEADVNATSSRWMPSISRQMESMSLGSTDDFSFTSPSSGYVYGEETTYLEDEQSVNFAMYRFKVEKCSKQFVHDWKECPFAHEGETARRRNPFSHTSQPCPDFKNNKCCPRYDQSISLCSSRSYFFQGQFLSYGTRTLGGWVASRCLSDQHVRVWTRM
mmetsp:Transcript_12668/g.35039  ORF Transcript_12668/g.35039 Transcript_12668/m.35039 type:complete len:263 (+) Transcript_12668:269-1057(+)